LFVVVGGALVVGIGGGSDPSAPEEAATDTTVGTGARRSPSTAGARPVSVEGPSVLVSAAVPYGTRIPVVGGLPTRTVMYITASGFPPSATGTVEQCSVGGCAHAFPVTFDANGDARFQYLVRDDFAAAFAPPSTCRADAAPCVVTVSAPEMRAHFTTVFHDAAPAERRVTLTPGAEGLVDGALVLVTATGFEAGEQVQAMLCAAPDTFGSTRCGAPGPLAQFTIGADGTGTASLTLREGRVGSDGARCTRGSGPCGIVVIDPRSAAPGVVAAFAFATGPGANYERDRLATGLVVALALLALASFLVRTTDWRKPSEADTPELDRATFLD
jgi:Neocarzinostatin family